MKLRFFYYYRLLFLFLAAGLCLLPLWATFLGGFKTTGDLRTNALGIPKQWVVENFISILRDPHFWHMLGNSAFIAFFTVSLTLIVSSMTAFTLAHLRFAGRRWLASYLTLGLTFPFATAVLPIFIRVRDLGLLDSLWGVILPQVAFNLSFSIVLLRGFFQEIPKELFEAALIDGCSYPRIFFQIVLPLSRPIIATVGVLSLVGSWNNFLLPLVMIDSDSRYPWPLGIMQYQGQYGTDWGRVLAFVSLTILPAVGFYLLAQKQIIAGLTSGAVKG
ncbi:MAG: carbohydrate ABC transporter permease [Verrucomicrobia bacterium]|nr:carbohydrate ABC transporter permease [Verrucomicrobiota bacterium]MBV9672847.1 carbohydrate ABC transporter permease [Verrucomicrobiota bacterium]